MSHIYHFSAYLLSVDLWNHLTCNSKYAFMCEFPDITIDLFLNLYCAWCIAFLSYVYRYSIFRSNIFRKREIKLQTTRLWTNFTFFCREFQCLNINFFYSLMYVYLVWTYRPSQTISFNSPCFIKRLLCALERTIFIMFRAIFFSHCYLLFLSFSPPHQVSWDLIISIPLAFTTYSMAVLVAVARSFGN